MKTYIFTDGASKGNPGPGGYGIVIKTDDHVTELGGGERETTNNRMELSAVICALEFLSGSQIAIMLFTDSSYVINGITKWVFNWEKNGWKTKNKTDVLNADLWKELFRYTKSVEIIWQYVPGHSDVAGNERANDIAEGFALNQTPELFSGNADLYSINLLDGEKPRARDGSIGVLVKDSETKKKKAGIAYSYVSLLDGEIKIHKTWDDCRARVHGKPARFKKALSKSEEEKIVREFKQ